MTADRPYPLIDAAHAWTVGSVTGLLIARGVPVRPRYPNGLFTAEFVVDLHAGDPSPPIPGIPHAHLIVLPPIPGDDPGRD